MLRAELHAHTDASNLKLPDAINTYKMLIDYGKTIGLSAIAITDHECLTNHVKAQKYFNEKYKDDEHYKLILGNEIYLTREGLDSTTHEKGERFYHLILLAKDAEGHKQLRQLSTRAWKRSYISAIARTPTYFSDLEEVVGTKPGHLICGTACLGNFAGHQFNDKLEGWETAIQKYLERLHNLFGDDFYIELQPGGSTEQIEYNKYMYRTYKDKYMFTLTTDAHYLTKEERTLHKNYLQSKDGAGNREVDEFYEFTYLMSSEEIAEQLSSYMRKETVAELLANSVKIADKIQTYSLLKDQHIPKIPLSFGLEEYEVRERFKALIPPKFPNLLHYYTTDNETDSYLAFLIASGYFTKIAGVYIERYFERLEEELSTYREISEKIKQDLSGYPVVMNKILEIVWTAGDSLIGPGRGSACGSLINYLCAITGIDPLQQELDMPFFRFLHPSRPELPD